MNKYAGGITIGLTLLAGLMLGVVLYAWWLEKKEHAKRRIPRRWPMAVRTITSSPERRTWQWLVRAFLDHHVMVKMPVTRFTLPQVKEEGQHWFQLLNGVNCTFTICTSEGSVIGCVDAPGPMGLSMSNQTLKHSLLSQCNIKYCVVDPDHLPNMATIRRAFLGDQAMRKEEMDRVRRDGAFNESRANLQTALLRRRHQKNSDFAELDINLDDGDAAYETHLSAGWEQNSFVTPLDSRTVELR